jgi:hypothetical protein
MIPMPCSTCASRVAGMFGYRTATALNLRTWPSYWRVGIVGRLKSDVPLEDCSAVGTFETFGDVPCSVAIRGKADITFVPGEAG